MIVLAIAAFLLTPHKGLDGLALLALIPLAPMACMMFVAAVIDLVVLVRRADRGNPWRVAAMHAVAAVGATWLGSWLAVTVLLGIVATQVIALRCFR